MSLFFLSKRIGQVKRDAPKRRERLIKKLIVASTYISSLFGGWLFSQLQIRYVSLFLSYLPDYSGQSDQILLFIVLCDVLYFCAFTRDSKRMQMCVDKIEDETRLKFCLEVISGNLLILHRILFCILLFIRVSIVFIFSLPNLFF